MGRTLENLKQKSRSRHIFFDNTVYRENPVVINI